MHPKAKAVANKIRRMREDRNYSQDYLAAKLGISQNAYSKIELGYSQVTIERLYRIAEVLEYNFADFFDEDELPGKNNFRTLG
ncbi:hypothetical protein GCM10023149_11790 [Mucilaginibacter gynuensis]|uniref:HTH cro/C1-type domain-containing protein n=1 Tax=Mucilaginibacter gynuensis TaxID=1302236 RepID=A0ABP8G1A5_9SPHI